MADPLTQPPPPAPSPLPHATAPIPKSRRRRWLKVLIAVLVVVLFGVAAAPTIIAKTGLRNRIARQVAPDLKGSLDIGSASLGWFSPIELRNVAITDAQGRVLAKIPRIASSKSLLDLVRDRANLGEFSIERPEIEVISSKTETNLEQVLSNYLKDDTKPIHSTRTEVTVRITGGSVTVREEERASAGAVRDLDATIVVPAMRSSPITLKLSANAPEKLDADASIGESGHIKLASSGLALEVVTPLLRRFEPELQLSGALTADLTSTWSKDSTSIDGKFGVKNLAVSGPYLNGDTLRIATAEMPVKAALSSRVIHVERAELTSEIGSVSVAGKFDPSESIEKALERSGTKLDVKVDLAKLAATLPKLLRVRDRTELRDGELIARLESIASTEGTLWTGKIDTTAIKAVRDGRELGWEEPLSVEFAGRYRPGQLPTFDKLICRSEFAAIQAEVKPDSIRAAASIYLDRFANRLADFIDLGGTTLDGRANATFVAQRTQDMSFKAEAKLDLMQFAFTDRDGKGIREPQLSLRVSGSGKAPEQGPISISTLTANLAGGGDELRLTLVEPIANLRELSSGKLNAKLTGDLGRWWSRVGSVVRLPQHYVLGGAATASGTIRLAPDSIAVDRLKLEIINASFRGAGLDLDEEQMDAAADVSFDRKTGTLAFEKFTVSSLPMSVTNGRLVIHAPANGELVVEGKGPAVVGLARLGKTLKLYTELRGPDSMRGRGTGELKFRYSAGVTTFGGRLDVANFSSGLPADPNWSEPTLRLEADGSYTESTDVLALTVAKIERPGLSIDTNVSLAKIATTADLSLTGKLSYDLAKLTPKLREMLSEGFTAQGIGSSPISLNGSLSPPKLAVTKGKPGTLASMSGGLRIAWDSVKAYGFDIGRSELHGKLTKGVLLVDPIVATFGGGKVNVHPTVHLEVEPGFVSIVRGKIIDRAKLTPAVCAEALGYALPAIAKSAKAEGDISITLEENRITFGDINKSRAKGQITVHNAAVSPGPVVGEIARLLGAGSVAMTIANDTVIPVQVENGAVHHQNLAVQIAGQTIVTSGSVGFDGKLNLTADVPIPASLLKGSPLAAKALAGKRVQIPIAGTLSQPTLDPKQFQAAIARLAQDAAKDIGKELLNKELEKLFPSMPAPKK
jgi:translocation and assembly module TamB